MDMAWKFEPKDVRDALKAFTRELAAPKARSLGWTFAADEDHIQRQFKAVSLSHFEYTYDSRCSRWPVSPTTQSNFQSGSTNRHRIVKVAMDMFSKWAKGDKSAIHPDLRSAVFAIAVKNGGKQEVSFQ